MTLILLGLSLIMFVLLYLAVKYAQEFSDQEAEWHREHYLNIGEDND